MPNNRYSHFYAAFNTAVKKGCNYSKEELVDDFTKGRTASLKELSDGELREIVMQLNGRTSTGSESWKKPPVMTEAEKKRDNMRKVIISIFKFMGKTTGDAIAWAEKYGCGGNKRRFNDYNEQELYVLIRNAETVKEDFLKAIRKPNSK